MAASVHAEEVSRILSATSHYEVLGSGLSPNSSDEEVRRIYLTLARRTHPDKNAHESAADAFKRVQNAFEALETQAKREQYHFSSRSRGLGHPDDDNNNAGGEDHFHAHSDFFRSAFNAGFGFGMNGRGFGPRGGLSPEDFLMEMFIREMLFGSSGGGGRSKRPGQFGEDDYDDDEGFDFDGDEGEGDGAAEFVDVGGGMFLCEGCGVYLFGEDALYEHDCDAGGGDDEYDDDDDEEGEYYEEEEEDNDEQADDPDGLEHIQVNTRTGQFRCGLCEVDIRGGEAKMYEHVQGKKHHSAMSRLARDRAPPTTHSASASRPTRSGLRYPGSSHAGPSRPKSQKSPSSKTTTPAAATNKSSTASSAKSKAKKKSTQGASSSSDKFHEDLVDEHDSFASSPAPAAATSQRNHDDQSQQKSKSQSAKNKKKNGKKKSSTAKAGERDLEPTMDEVFEDDFGGAAWPGSSPFVGTSQGFSPSATASNHARMGQPRNKAPPSFACDLCKIVMSSQVELNQHLMGKRHAKEAMKKQ